MLTFARMHIPEHIISFLRQVKDVSIGYNQIRFLDPSVIEAGQTGYSIDEEGNSLVTGEYGAWEDSWLVIGNDRLGDPVFVDTTSKDGTVMIAAAGDEADNEWDPIFIADNLGTFHTLIDALHVLSADRNDPVALKVKPIGIEERQAFLKMVTKQNPGSDIWFWEDFLE